MPKDNAEKIRNILFLSLYRKRVVPKSIKNNDPASSKPVLEICKAQGFKANKSEATKETERELNSFFRYIKNQKNRKDSKNCGRQSFDKNI